MGPAASGAFDGLQQSSSTPAQRCACRKALCSVLPCLDAPLQNCLASQWAFTVMQWHARPQRRLRGGVCSFGQVRRWADWADPPYPSLHVTSGLGLGGGQGERGRREDELAVSKPRMAEEWQHYSNAGWLGGWGLLSVPCPTRACITSTMPSRTRSA